MVEGLVHHPQYAQHTQGTQERSQFRDVMERRNKPQSADTHNQHHHTLPAVQAGIIATIRRRTPGSIQSVRQFFVNQYRWNHPCQDSRNGQISREVTGCYSPVAPQNQTYRVANYRKASTTVGCQHDGRTHIHPLSRVLQNVMHDDQHHGRRCQVVQIGREDKRSQRDGPQQSLGITRTNPFCDEVEAAIIVQQFHYRHGSQQEQYNGSSLAHVFQEYIIFNKVFHRLAGGLVACQPLHILTRMLVHHEV